MPHLAAGCGGESNVRRGLERGARWESGAFRRPVEQQPLPCELIGMLDQTPVTNGQNPELFSLRPLPEVV
jgi:hypothetical protein